MSIDCRTTVGFRPEPVPTASAMTRTREFAPGRIVVVFELDHMPPGASESIQYRYSILSGSGVNAGVAVTVTELAADGAEAERDNDPE
jgi:hypothetical protein